MTDLITIIEGPPLVIELDTIASGPPGPAGADGDKHFTYTQMSASAVWTVVHNLGKVPSVVVIDSANSEVEGNVVHDALDPINKLVITFSAAFAGQAFCN